MKKLFSIILAICLMASLCVTAFAEGSAVITVSGEKVNGDISVSFVLKRNGFHTSFLTQS